MKPFLALAGALLAAAVAAPASAALVEYQYSGSVAAVFGPAPDGVVAGDPVHVRVRFDTADLTDVTANANFVFGTAYTDLDAATLRGPQARLDISVGPNSFTKDDVFFLGGDPFLAGGSPYVLFNNGNFFGVQFFGVNAATTTFVTAGAAPEMFDFVGGGFAIGGPSYGGFFDYANAASRGVPEPASWALMICGFGLAGVALRRRRAALA